MGLQKLTENSRLASFLMGDSAENGKGSYPELLIKAAGSSGSRYPNYR
jgi:hypothetical protein